MLGECFPVCMTCYRKCIVTDPRCMWTGGQKIWGDIMLANDWKHNWDSPKQCSPDVMLQETNFKVMARWYWVSVRSEKANPGVLPICFRNCGQSGSYLHVWWTCPQFQSLWKKVFNCINKMFQAQVLLAPETALLLKNQHNSLIDNTDWLSCYLQQ